MGQAADLSGTLAVLQREVSLTGNDVRLFKAVAQAISSLTLEASSD